MTTPPVEPPEGPGDIPTPPTPPVPPPPPVPPVPPMGAPGAPSGPSGQKNDTAMIALIAGILSIFCFGPLAGIPAMILGSSAKKKAAQMGGEGEGQAKAGQILGAIGTILWVIGVIIWILIIVFAADSIDSASDRLDKRLKETQSASERYGETVDEDNYTISDEEVEVEDGGYVTYSAKIENNEDFTTGYDITVSCSGSEGDEDDTTAYVYTVKEGGVKSFDANFYFDYDTTDAECGVDEVTYNY